MPTKQVNIVTTTASSTAQLYSGARVFAFRDLCNGVLKASASQALKGALQVGLAIGTLGAVGLIVPRHYDMRPDIKTNFSLAIEV